MHQWFTLPAISTAAAVYYILLFEIGLMIMFENERGNLMTL